VLPEQPGERSGYQKAVRADLDRLQPTTEDVVCCYATAAGPPEQESSATPFAFIRIPRPPRYSLQRLANVCRGRVSGELALNELKKNIPVRQYSQIFCGEVTLYRALRKLYPRAPITVRFHNFFFVSTVRNEFLGYRLPLPTRLHFYLLGRLEKEILKDRLVTPVFITEEERRFFKMIYPRREAYAWGVTTSAESEYRKPIVPDQPRLVWFGGLSAHKKYSLAYFIKRVYLPLRQSAPDVELHLFGAGTTEFDSPDDKVFGHGYFQGKGYPFEGNALFINPDLLGGGVKLKVDDWLRDGLPFISTPFGVEGYKITGNRNVVIEEIDQWGDAILRYFYENTKQ